MSSNHHVSMNTGERCPADDVRGAHGQDARQPETRRRHVHARRRSRLTAGATVLVAVLLLAACDWTQFRLGAGPHRFNPTETKISPANVVTS